MDMKTFRIEKGLNQEEFGKISNTDQAEVSRWESEDAEKKAVPTPEKVRAMIAHFQGDLTYEIIYGNPLQETGTG